MTDTTELIKQSIIEMAISGELVEQKPDEGTAIELINKIRENKEQNKSKDFQIVIEKKGTFEIPDNWELVDLESIIEIVGNKNNQIKSKQVQDNGAIPVVSQGKNLIDGYSDQVSRAIKITEPLILFGDHTKNVKYIDFDFIIGADGTKIFRSIILIPKFLYYWTMYASSIIEDRGYNRHYALLKKVPVTFPPLLEQKRIVSKIEEIFSIIDKIAERKDDALQTIELIRETTLQQAIQGKLVEQNEEDEPASELITRIEEEKHKFIKEKKIKKEKKLPDVSEAEKSFAIPANWEWVRLGNILNIIMGQSPKGNTVSEDSNGIEFHQGKTNFGKKYLLKSEVKTVEPKKVVEKDTVLLSVRAPVGDLNITNREIAIGRGLCGINPYVEMKSDYIYYTLSALEREMKDKSTGTTFKAISGKTIKNLVLPLPPIEEQNRIIEEIEQIMKICDQMEELFK